MRNPRQSRYAVGCLQLAKERAREVKVGNRSSIWSLKQPRGSSSERGERNWGSVLTFES